MHPAYSVILFTTASGAGYGMLALLGLVGVNHGQASSPAFGLVSMVLALALVTIGLLASTLHLGRPERELALEPPEPGRWRAASVSLDDGVRAGETLTLEARASAYSSYHVWITRAL